MTVNSILNNALSGLAVGQAGLREATHNVSNVNTEGYVRREVVQQTVTLAGQPAGVEVGQVRRAADVFLQAESRTAMSGEARYEAQTRTYDRLMARLGDPSTGGTLASKINAAFSAFADFAVDSTSAVQRTNALSALTSMGNVFSDLHDEIQSLRQQSDALLAADVDEANTLLRRLDELNRLVARESVSGGQDSALQDQVDASLDRLSELMDIRVTRQSDGSVHVATGDGFQLVGAGRAELRYDPENVVNASTAFAQIEAYWINPQTGGAAPVGLTFNEHLDSGSMFGHLQMRDVELPQIAEELGELAGGIADAINAAHNDHSSVPGAQSLTGRATGLLGTDAHNFTGQATFAVTGSTGTLVRRVDVDFSAGTYSVNGGAAVAFGGTTVAAMVAAINTGLGTDATLAFSAGQMTLSAAATGNGVSVMQDGTTPSDRGGRGFAHFFGLNDLLSADRNSFFETGLAATDAHGFSGSLQFGVYNEDGRALETITVSPSGTTMSDLLTQLNASGTGLGDYGSFSLDSDGELLFTLASGLEDYRVQLQIDSTERGSTGVGFTDLFGFAGASSERAKDLGLSNAVETNANLFASASLDITGTTVPGDLVLAAGDNRGAFAIQALINQNYSFAGAGGLSATSSTIGDYAAAIASDMGLRAASSEAFAADASALKNDVQLRRDEVQGVNLDEEMANVVIYQQAYNASARMIQAAQELFDTLIAAV